MQLWPAHDASLAVLYCWYIPVTGVAKAKAKTKTKAKAWAYARTSDI
jgi:hypothetical protein